MQPAVKFQCGFLRFDGKEASRAEMAEVLGEYCDVEAETHGEHLDGSLGMAYRGVRITCEEDGEKQPLQDSPFVVTFDGRLDNREEVGSYAGMSSVNGVSDPALVLAVFKKLGEAGFEKLIGEFALVLWCRHTDGLMFIRSECGARPLYYVKDRDRMVWSSDFAHLVRVSGVDLAINEDYVLEYLYSQPHQDESPLRDVLVAIPGKAMRFANGVCVGQRLLWNANNVTPLNYRSDGEYEEHFRTIVRQTMRCRLRAKGVVFTELSGGFDSSTMVLCGDQVLEASGRPKESVRTLSCVYELSRSSDESYFVKKVEEHRGIDGCHLSEVDQGLTLGLKGSGFWGLPSGLVCNAGRVNRVPQMMRDAGARVLLSGEGGDHLFWSSTRGVIPVAEELWRLRMGGMHLQCMAWSKATLTPYWRLVAMSVAMTARTAGPGRWHDEIEDGPTLLTRKYSKRLREIGRPAFDYKIGGSPGFKALCHRISDLLAMASAGYHHTYRGIYLSYPFTHRRLLEFCLGVPVSQFLRGGVTRSLMRRSLRLVLPEAVNKRQSKGSPRECILRVLHRDWDDIGDVGKWELCRREFFVASEMAESLEKLKAGLSVLELPLFRATATECWLRSLGSIKRRSRDVSTGKPVLISA